MDKLIFLWWNFPRSAPVQSQNHSPKNLTGRLPSGKESNVRLLKIKLSGAITLSSTYTHIYPNIPALQFWGWAFSPDHPCSYTNLVPSASFRYKSKAKKRPWNSSNTWSKFAQIEGIFLRINYEIRGRQY